MLQKKYNLKKKDKSLFFFKKKDKDPYMCLKTENMCLNFLVFKHMFLVFKQHYTYFYIFFHLYIFLKDTNNITRTTLPNTLKYYTLFIYTVFAFFFFSC